MPVPQWLRALGDETAALAAKGGGQVRAPMPSLVVDVKVNVGDVVEKGQALVVLESMKTETVLRANASGAVAIVGCKKGEMVEEGKVLVEVEVEEEGVK